MGKQSLRVLKEKAGALFMFSEGGCKNKPFAKQLKLPLQDRAQLQGSLQILENGKKF